MSEAGRADADPGAAARTSGETRARETGDGRILKGEPLHPRVAAAAEGVLPEWTEASPERRAHMERVAGLLSAWAERRGLPAHEVARWTAAGNLHDLLRDADPARLRSELSGPLADLPGPILHGPAAARRLEAEGVEDRELLDAIRYHTVGHPSLGTLGRALFAADFLEPGRRHRREWRDALAERAPEDLDGVLREIVAARISFLVEAGRPIRAETAELWNMLVGPGQAWAGGSEV